MMSQVRMVLSLAAATLVAGGMYGAVASAQSIEIVEEPSGVHCSPVTLVGTDVSGGCVGHATSESGATMSAFGSVISVCDLKFVGHMDENGHGYLTEAIMVGPSCTTTPCEDGGEMTPWEINLTEPSPDMIEGEVNFCVVSATFGAITCHISSIGFTPIGHSKEEDWQDAPCENAPFLTLSGHGATEDLNAELIHQ